MLDEPFGKTKYERFLSAKAINLEIVDSYKRKCLFSLLKEATIIDMTELLSHRRFKGKGAPLVDIDPFKANTFMGRPLLISIYLKRTLLTGAKIDK